MTTTFTVDKSFAYIDRLTKHGTTFAACAGIYNRVIIAARASGGGVNLTGVSSQLTAQPLDIVSDGTPSAYYVLTPKGVTTLSTAANPAITAESVFDTGSNRWLFYSGGNLIVPTAGGGVRLQTAAGTVRAELSGLLSESTAAAFSGSALYIFGAKRGKMAVVTVTATALVYEGTFDAPNCREVLRAVIDGTNLYCLNLHRIVRFSIAAPTAPVLAQDYGKTSVEFTDIAVIASNKIWVGTATSTPGLTGPEFFGPVYGVYDSANLEIQTAAPRMSAWMVGNVIPYYTSTTIGTIVTTPPPPAVIPPPPVIAPPAPVITSSLTASVTEDSAFSYTITATGAGPIAYGVVSPPSWLTSIDPLTGVISGTPPDPATVSITITATNAGGTDTKTLVVTVLPGIGNNTGVYTNGAIEDIYVEASTKLIYAVGSFTSVTDSNGTYTRNRGACLNPVTGLWTAWNPDANNTPNVVWKHSDGYVYIGFTAASTIGGTSVSRLGRCHATTGAVDATFSHTFDSGVYALCSVGVVLYVGGDFTTVDGGAASGNCAFNNNTNTGWAVQGAGGGLYSVSPLYGIGKLRTLKAAYGGVFGAGNCLIRNASTDRALGYFFVDATVGAGIQHTFGGYGVPSKGNGGCVALDGSVYYPGSGAYTTLATSTAYGNFTGGHITPTTADTGFNPTFGGSPLPADILQRPDGTLLYAVNGASSYNGDTAKQGLSALTAGGANATDFTFWTRGNGNFQSSIPTVRTVRSVDATTCVVGGTIGGAAATYDGTRVTHILVLNQYTGARL